MAGDWIEHAAIQIVIGFELCVFGTLTSDPGDKVFPIIIIAFAFYAPCVLIVGAMVQHERVKGFKLAVIATIILLIIAGGLCIAGIAVEETKYNLNVYTGALECTGGVMALLGALFLICALFSNRVGTVKERRSRDQRVADVRVTTPDV